VIRGPLLCVLLAVACSDPGPSRGTTPPIDFNAYWHAGKAELNRYTLVQARYGELHEGDAVLVFVTEDFLPDRQVKSEAPIRPPGAVPVLKLNLVKEVNTGIYRYSMMSSVFTPTAPGAKTLKVATSVQEWCGQTYLQMNLREGTYEAVSHSYFEREGDDRFRLPGVLLEDEVWTRIRLSPERLPTGPVQAIPGTLSARLRHRRLAAEPAQATLERGARESRYVLEYPDARRTLAIRFRTAFPHEIVAFDETYPDGGRMLTTRAVRTHALRLAYWQHARHRDRPLRRQLGLPAER
jgi:hypothetical protein